MAAPYETLDTAQRLVNEDGRPTPYFETFLYETLMVLGSGSPAATVSAKPGTLYIDTAAATGGVLYAKQTGTGTSGWQLIG